MPDIESARQALWRSIATWQYVDVGIVPDMVHSYFEGRNQQIPQRQEQCRATPTSTRRIRASPKLVVGHWVGLFGFVGSLRLELMVSNSLAKH